jgi:hypothetical protein
VKIKTTVECLETLANLKTKRQQGMSKNEFLCQDTINDNCAVLITHCLEYDTQSSDIQMMDVILCICINWESLII